MYRRVAGEGGLRHTGEEVFNQKTNKLTESMKQTAITNLKVFLSWR